MENIVALFFMIVPFLAVLTIIVFVHEMGHYLVARWNGIAVQVFAIGFGPELFGFNDKNGTRWKVCAIPLGGYVKFVGDMNAASMPNREGLEQFDAQTQSSLFFYKNVWQRIAVVIAGPIANIIFTFIVLYALLVGLGRYTLEAQIDGVEPQSPASIAGFMPEDRIVRVDGYLIRSFGDFQRIVATSPERDILVEIDRLGTAMTLDVRTGVRERTDQFGNISNVGYLGVSRNATQEDVIFVRPNPVEAVVITVDEMILIVDRSFKFLGELLVGKGDVDQLGGPVKIAKISGEAATLGVFTLINLMALLSLNIGIFNLFPIPMLDGGHLVYYFYEVVRGKPLSEKFQEMGYRFGMFIVLSLMVFSVVNDIF
ncbi:RIP metalloprotease RseP [Maritalea porphyrae]|uniref:RIP metalloprotease RseP n=1 Tax=Maritalea porphyrae TaxID=880732 RepID=UPI0022AF1353|nr:RIP metalloprotease RseP [Maritalea porphyrae]MCZ4273035.1 RIP metalloprotease RseP [Maritalea porphyrae]